MDVYQILTHALAEGASDIHLSPGRPPLLRVDGDLAPLRLAESGPQPQPLSAAAVNAMLETLMAEPHKRRFASALQEDFALVTPQGRRFRVNVFRQRCGAAAVLRPLPEAVPELAALGAPAVLEALALRPRGLVLVTGATGSGKSTTLAAMLRHLGQRRAAHVLTIEDPIEFVHEGGRALFSQRQLHRDAPDAPAALRAALREDPDVIMVGEARDTETMRLALSAAETGHLVLATLHTASACKTVERVVDLFPGGEQAAARAMLAECLSGVVSQVLLKRCGGGRVAAWEVLVATRAVRNLVREGKTAQLYSAMQAGRDAGMQTLEQSLRVLVERGEVAAEEARRMAAEP